LEPLRDYWKVTTITEGNKERKEMQLAYGGGVNCVWGKKGGELKRELFVVSQFTQQFIKLGELGRGKKNARTERG